jgi:ribosomal protein L29
VKKRMLELQKKAPAELVKELERIDFDLMRLRAQTATGSAGKDAGRIRVLRRDRARIMGLQKRMEVQAKQ